MSDDTDSVQTVDGERREEEWLRLAQLMPKSQWMAGAERSRLWTRVFALMGIFFAFFGVWWLRYIWSVAGLYYVFSIGGLLLVFAPISLAVLLLITASKKPS